MANLSRRQIAAPLMYVAASAAFVVLVGVPYQRDLLAIWLLLGCALMAACAQAIFC